ncbi:MAG: hypothetical protein M1820_010019 [Bogoriella megaspora]|nr:MAG: hypothetical protein M1820_010019 [Bogoriella megaspora]
MTGTCRFIKAIKKATPCKHKSHEPNAPESPTVSMVVFSPISTLPIRGSSRARPNQSPDHIDSLLALLTKRQLSKAIKVEPSPSSRPSQPALDGDDLPAPTAQPDRKSFRLYDENGYRQSGFYEHLDDSQELQGQAPDGLLSEEAGNGGSGGSSDRSRGTALSEEAPALPLPELPGHGIRIDRLYFGFDAS